VCVLMPRIYEGARDVGKCRRKCLASTVPIILHFSPSSPSFCLTTSRMSDSQDRWARASVWPVGWPMLASILTRYVGRLYFLLYVSTVVCRFLFLKKLDLEKKETVFQNKIQSRNFFWTLPHVLSHHIILGRD
jgi:hypothetical protein